MYGESNTQETHLGLDSLQELVKIYALLACCHGLVLLDSSDFPSCGLQHSLVKWLERSLGGDLSKEVTIIDAPGLLEVGRDQLSLMEKN
jgi:hypothetical protein